MHTHAIDHGIIDHGIIDHDIPATIQMTAPNDTHLRSLIRSVLHEDGYVKREDSEQTIENSLQPCTPSPSVDPFTHNWYNSLIPHKTRQPFICPDTKPQFFNIRDAQHTTIFNPTGPAGACQEADILYQSIAYLHRVLDDLLPLIDGLQLVDTWKSVKGVTEMLHTRYDLLCALRRSRDDQHIRFLEVFMQPPSGDGAASARIHREICRAVSKKRPRDDVDDADPPPQSRAKTEVKEHDHPEDHMAIAPPVKASPKVSTLSDDTKNVKAKAASSTKTDNPRTPRSKSVSDTSKKRTLLKNGAGAIVSRTRSSDVTKRLRSQSAQGASGTKATKAVNSLKSKEPSSAKKTTPKKQSTATKKATPVKTKAEPEKKTSSKPAATDKKTTPKKQRVSTKAQPSSSGSSKKAPGEKRVSSSKKVVSGKKESPRNPSTPVKKMSSVKKSDSRSKAVSKNASNVDNGEGKVVDGSNVDEKISPDPMNDANVTTLQTDEEVEVVHVKLGKNERPNADKKDRSVRTTTLAKTSGDRAKHRSKHPVTNFIVLVRGDSAEEVNSSVHTYAGYLWRLVVYPLGDNHKDWMSVYLECRGPEPSEASTSKGNPSTAETAETEEAKSDRAWFIRVKFSVRVLRTESPVTKAVLQGKDVTVGDVDYDEAFQGASKVNPHGTVLPTGLLSDFVGAISHDFSSLSDRVGFSRLAPTSCLNPGMYADDDKNIVLMLFMCAQ